ncbi:glycoside hydrolase family 32 protein [Mucilaginibacter sp.]|jgi:fructan beta-fructosidase|uniref:glycoside hydrolase family 32 protein n=1 Tax=Mucilaginibacter sp. TaxID=1882438 RepID=UPI002B69E037|nr:glycoside hydrolase family 32 protein [Mucilaginibacter sp.]HTI58325.1 glycoside hydrolase family 32 protein [Mucilaginibacter sp.]
MIKKAIFFFTVLITTSSAFGQKTYHEQYRPQIHFSPAAHWMNDPNGLVYYKGVYHLFYQYYPKATVWGPMHWGHATSTDLVHWNNKPIALYPDSLGLIFSGSAVVDINNTSGLGKNGRPPLIAIFTHHDQAKEKDGKNDTENESMAYSNDGGNTWQKYAHNPVLKNPGISDFRDPKVSWYAPGKKWIMTLATKDRITFYSSPNLKDWTKESEFGETLGAHGGVWECPDLFPMTAADGKKMWVLIVNINPGGPQGGSATQYFTGDFDGKTFKPNNTDTRWADQGTDEYAGVTWSNTGNRRIFLGWMSNWNYATTVPTKAWRSAMTIPRDLKLVKVDTAYYLASQPVKELGGLKDETKSLPAMAVKGEVNLTKILNRSDNQFQLSLSAKQLKGFSITLSNGAGDKLLIGFDEKENSWFIDRTHAGESGFNNDFAKRFAVKRIGSAAGTDMTLVVDAASVELFADKGLTVMTSIFFPKKPLNNISVSSADGFSASSISYAQLKSIWP